MSLTIVNCRNDVWLAAAFDDVLTSLANTPGYRYNLSPEVLSEVTKGVLGLHAKDNKAVNSPTMRAGTLGSVQPDRNMPQTEQTLAGFLVAGPSFCSSSRQYLILMPLSMLLDISTASCSCSRLVSWGMQKAGFL